MNTVPSMSLRDTRHQQTIKRLLIHSVLSAVAMVAICAFYPLGRPVDETMTIGFRAAHFWVATQSICLTTSVYLVFGFASRWFPRVAFWVGNALLVLMPVLCVLDCVMFHLVGERFLSAVTIRILVSLLPGLLPYLSLASIAVAIGVMTGIVLVTVAIAKFSWFIHRRWTIGGPRDVHPMGLAFVVVMLPWMASIPAWMNFHRTLDQMAEASVRHPWCMLRLVGYHGVGVRELTGGAAIRSQLEGLQLYDVVQDRVERFNQITLSDQTLSRLRANDESTQQPDVVIVVLESLRHEAVTNASMPKLTAFMQASGGRRFQNHFSGGNSTNRGMFALVNGTHSIWFDQAANFSPLMNKLFRQAGYELGFFGSSSGWDVFDMDTFISSEHFDEFQIEPEWGLREDQLAVDRATQYLAHDRSDRPPRLAMVYIYCSHAPFRSLPQHDVFQPAAGPWYVTPYTESMRPAVWNRYLNSIRTIDHVIEPLLRPDRIVVVVGDHGEAFLEDGTIGHGGRLAKVQNMTPALMHFPNRPLPETEGLTSHADVLPTMLRYLDLTVSDPAVFDGGELWRPPSSDRTVSSMHYLGPEVLLAGSWTLQADQPFGYRFAYSLSDWFVGPLNPIDDVGQEWRPTTNDNGDRMDQLYHQWLLDHFGVDVSADPRTDNELFVAAFDHPVTEVRLQAIEIARQIDRPDSTLIRLVSEATADPDANVRALARDVVIELQRRRK